MNTCSHLYGNKYAPIMKDGYCFYAGFTSVGPSSDFAPQIPVQPIYTAGNIALARQLCDANPACVGFDTDGWLKQSIAPQTSWNYYTTASDKGLYIKTSQPNQILPLVAPASGCCLGCQDSLGCAQCRGKRLENQWAVRAIRPAPEGGNAHLYGANGLNQYYSDTSGRPMVQYEWKGGNVLRYD